MESYNAEVETWTNKGREYEWVGGYKENISDYPYFMNLCDGEIEAIKNLPETISYINHGSGRIVLKHENLAYKIPRYGHSSLMGDGKEMNKIEYKRWSQNKTYPLIPVLDYNESYIVMPYVEQAHEKIEKEEIYNDIIEGLEYLNINTTDIKIENIGYYDKDDTWMLLDYGQYYG